MLGSTANALESADDAIGNADDAIESADDAIGNADPGEPEKTFPPPRVASPAPARDRASAVAALDEELSSRLRRGGNRVTAQRLFVHRALRAQDRHLTAEQVLDAVSNDLPSISLPTIYATLELLEELGLLRRVAAGTGAVLYETRTTPHAHATCRRCGAVQDVEQPELDASVLDAARVDGFEPDHAQLLIWGLCASCAASGA